jgi:hypothetical protein
VLLLLLLLLLLLHQLMLARVDKLPAVEGCALLQDTAGGHLVLQGAAAC